jgi:hypothetical protein
MAIPNLGPLGMPDSQYQAAMINVSDKAAHGTGKAREHSHHTVESEQLHDDESVQLSALAQHEAEQMEKDSQKDAQQGVRNDRGTQNMEEQGRHNVLGFAAQSSGSKDEKAVKEKKPKTTEESDDPQTMMESLTTELGQMHDTGITDDFEKKLRKKGEEEDPLHSDVYGIGGNGLLDAAQQSKVYKAKEPDRLEIEKVMNRTPDEILNLGGPIKKEHLPTAKMMVAGQMPNDQPTKALTQLKNPDNIRECALLAPPLDIDPSGGGQIADIFDEAPPIPELMANSEAFT